MAVLADFRIWACASRSRRCRFQGDSPISHREILVLLERVTGLGLDFIKTENLCTFDGEPGYSLGQGQ